MSQVGRTYYRVKGEMGYCKDRNVGDEKPIRAMIIGNHKMSMSVREAVAYYRALRAAVLNMRDIEVGIAPSALNLSALNGMERPVAGYDPISLGVQDVHKADKGAYTGEISAEQAVSAGASFAIIGHSEWREARLCTALGEHFREPVAEDAEGRFQALIKGDVASALLSNVLLHFLTAVGPRREGVALVEASEEGMRTIDSALQASSPSQYLSRRFLLSNLLNLISINTDSEVNLRVQAALRANLKPIVCVGETLEQRRANQAEEIVKQQMTAGLNGLTAAQMAKVVVAYEPVWAIGTGLTATPEQADAMHHFIRNIAREQHGEEIALALRVLYGGSVKPDNISALMAMPNIDGALVGGASLNPDQFALICRFGLE